MVSHVNFVVMNLDLSFGHGGYYRIIEAIVKGGYN
nr:MAG TPA: cellulose synthase operon protein [Caudoviricetes sp.]